jgi:hypothetical protein
MVEGNGAEACSEDNLAGAAGPLGDMALRAPRNTLERAAGFHSLPELRLASPAPSLSLDRTWRPNTIRVLFLRDPETWNSPDRSVFTFSSASAVGSGLQSFRRRRSRPPGDFSIAEKSLVGSTWGASCLRSPIAPTTLARRPLPSPLGEWEGRTAQLRLLCETPV